MRLFTRNIVLFLSLLISISDTYATHLVGGSMSYEYKGRLPNGKYRYLLTIDMYRDCTGDVLFDDIIQVSAHHNNSTRTLFQAFPIRIVSKTLVNPPNGGVDCAFQPNVCLERGFYEAMIDLDPSSSGYHLVFQRCCRNTQENLIDDIGQTYYAFIPPTSIQNSSPTFTGVPSPYICQNDLISIDNGARDPDGDSLVYSLEHPWAGGSEFDPFPQPRQTWPQIPAFDPVIYRPGHSVQSPFGVNGVCDINSMTGLTDLKAPRRGRYSIAIVVSEYRNGVLLSKVRLDIQMIVIYCPPNDVPVITPKSGQYDYEVYAGERLCFDIDVTDPDNDNLKVTGSGDIFNLPNKPLLSNSSGGSQITVTFCWTPTCNQVRNFPYGLSILAQDDGCPPKKRGETFNIFVREFIGVQNITGPNQSCENDTKKYNAAGKAGSSYEWSINPVTAGQIIGNTNQSSVDVKWLFPGNATLTVTEINSANCRGIAASKNISIIASPPVPIISGKDTACEYSTNEIYSIPSTPGYTYSWSISGGTISGANNTANVNVNWGVEGVGNLRVVQTNAQGCSGDTGKFTVALVKSRIDSLYGSPSVCPNIKGVTYEVLNSNPLSVYIWNISGGTQSSGGNTSSITVNWGGTGMGYVEVTELSKFGCLSDPERLNVEINHKLQGMVPVGLDTLCEFSTGVKYKVIYTTGSTYYWSIQNGTIVQDDSTNEVVVDWGSTGTGRLTVYEVSYDSLGNKPCISSPIQLNIFLAPIPVDNGIVGPDEICQSGVLQLYSTQGFAGSEFKWTYDGPGTIKGQGNDSVLLSLSSPGTFNISLIETSRYGCKGPVIQKSIIVHPRPVTKGIFGDSTVCYPNYTDHGYYVQGFDSSIFTWTLIGGALDSGQGTDSIVADWSGQADNLISVYETSNFGCVGDTLKMKVFADNPSIDLHVVSVGYPKDDRMEIKWELINAPRYNNDFTVFRRNVSRWGETGEWKPVESVEAVLNTYTDRKLNTDLNPFEYMIAGKNLCGDSIFSDIHRNVLITGRKAEGGYSVALEWTRYLGWTDGVRNYELYRKNGNEEYIPFEQKGLDTIAGYDDGDESYMQCYRIKSYEINGNNEESWSNDICFEFDPLLWIPNAFTGNGDALNPTFLLKGVAIKTFSITIYDRWGEQIYYSENLKESWDGTYKGREVPSGVFVYVVKFTGADDVLQIRKGNITLLR